MRRPLVALLLSLIWIVNAVPAQEPSAATSAAPATAVGTGKGITLGETHVHHIRVGLRIKAAGPCQGIVASFPVPMDWPEQKVQVVKEQISPSVRNVTSRLLEDGVKQMVVSIPRLNGGEVAEAVLTLAIERQVILGPPQTDLFTIPKQPDKSIRRFLGDSPYIETRNNKIRALARQIVTDKEGAWQQVEAIYDYVRDHVEYRESELKGAVDALNDGHGDCEAMTSLFIALCRANKIPARMVWVTDHSYPEFYLLDDEKQGHWFPCQISGSRALGNMPEVRPILQKGDNYRIPETKERRRYVSTQLKAAAVRGGSPDVTEILEFTNPNNP